MPKKRKEISSHWDSSKRIRRNGFDTNSSFSKPVKISERNFVELDSNELRSYRKWEATGGQLTSDQEHLVNSIYFPQYNIDRIRGHCVVLRYMYLLVEWTGFPNTDTYEPYVNLMLSPKTKEMTEDYLLRMNISISSIDSTGFAALLPDSEPDPAIIKRMRRERKDGIVVHHPDGDPEVWSKLTNIELNYRVSGPRVC